MSGKTCQWTSLPSTKVSAGGGTSSSTCSCDPPSRAKITSSKKTCVHYFTVERRSLASHILRQAATGPTPKRVFGLLAISVYDEMRPLERSPTRLFTPALNTSATVQ